MTDQEAPQQPDHRTPTTAAVPEAPAESAGPVLPRGQRAERNFKNTAAGKAKKKAARKNAAAPAAEQRRAAALRSKKCRWRKKNRELVAAGQPEVTWDEYVGAVPYAPLHPMGEDGTAGSDGNDAADAVAKGEQRRAERQGYNPRPRAIGWLRRGEVEGVGLTSGQLREQARRVLEVDGIPYLQEVLADPDAKDADRLRSVDLLAKIAVGYMTPDTMDAEDAPQLPPPIFESTEGGLPGGDAPMYDDSEVVTTAAEDDAAREPTGAVA